MNKIDEIDRIYRLWSGGFKNSTSAMSDIGRILKIKEVSFESGTLYCSNKIIQEGLSGKLYIEK